MKHRNLVSRFGLAALAGSLAIGGVSCAPTEEDGDSIDPDEIVGTNSVARTVSLQSFVYVPVGASDRQIQEVAVAQIRPLFGALKAHDIGLGRRLDTPSAYTAIDTSTFVRDEVTVVDPARPGTTTRMLRVKFSYSDRATVTKRLQTRRAFATTLLFNVGSRGSEIVNACQSEHQDWGTSGLWYNFEPHLSACQSLVTAEKDRITTQRRALTDADHQITVDEAARTFLPTTLKITTIARTENKYPDYHRLFDDNRLVVASYFGVDKLDDPNDYGARNFFTYIRTVLRARPELQLQPVAGSDFTRISFNGATISNVTPLQVAGWIVDRTGYPSSVPYAMVDAFRRQVIAQWRDKTLSFTSPATVTINGATKSVTAELRVFYGNEEGYGTGAVQRYQSAFRDADVFQYTGHSHLGSGPLDARNYSASSFPNRYQIMMVNSCVSFNYYNTYFDMHPGGTLNLDTVTNGLPVYLEGSGESSARFAVAFFDARFRSYVQVLTAMHLNLPWASNYDANRVADGESDNTFSPASTRMTMTFPAR